MILGIMSYQTFWAAVSICFGILLTSIAAALWYKNILLATIVDLLKRIVALNEEKSSSDFSSRMVR